MSEQPPFPMRHSRIGYNNIAKVGNVTASSEDNLWPAMDAVTPLTYEGWKPLSLPAELIINAGEAAPADYVGIASHTLFSTGCTAYIECSDDSIDWVTVATIEPSSDEALMVFFDEVVAQYWRLRITGGTDMPLVCVFFVGVALQMQRPMYSGHTPLTMAQDTEYTNSISEAGQFLGRSIIRKGAATDFSWSNLTAAWVRQYFNPFRLYARTGAFFIAWNPLQFPGEVGFVWTAADIKPSNAGPRDLMTVSFNAGGVDGR